MAAATVGLRVVFIEADLRRPAAAKHFGTDAEPGLSEVLVGAISLADAVQKVELATHKGLTIGLDVLVAGGVLPPNPAQVIESRAMESVLDEARDLYDLVIVDTSPTGGRAGRVPLAAPSRRGSYRQSFGSPRPRRGSPAPRYARERECSGNRSGGERLRAPESWLAQAGMRTSTGTTTRLARTIGLPVPWWRRTDPLPRPESAAGDPAGSS